MRSVKEETNLTRIETLHVAKRLDKVITDQLGKKHATLSARYANQFDKRVEKGIDRVMVYSTKMRITEEEYLWRAIKALLSRGNKNVNVFTLMTHSTYQLTAQMGAGEELYSGYEQEHRTIQREDTTQVTDGEAITKSIVQLRQIFTLHTVNAGHAPALLDVLLAMRKELHPILLYDYLPMRTVWKRCRKVLDIQHDYGSIAIEHTRFVSTGAKGIGTEQALWWTRCACSGESELGNAVFKRGNA